MTTGYRAANPRERALSAFGATVIVCLIGYLLFFGLPIRGLARAREAIALLPIHAPVPDPSPKPEPSHATPSPVRAAARAAPAHFQAKATPIVAPVPVVRPLAPTPVLAAPRAGPGTEAEIGASYRPGAGTGAGGDGDGMGSGGDGDADGGGKGGETPPRLIKGRLRFTDLSRDLREGRIGGTVSVRYEVDPQGHVGACTVTRSSGNDDLDSQTCTLIQRRFRYEPARDEAGEATRSTVEEDHRWVFERNGNQDAVR